MCLCLCVLVVDKILPSFLYKVLDWKKESFVVGLTILKGERKVTPLLGTEIK